VPIGAAAEARAVILAEQLRDAGLVVDLGYSGNVQRRMRRADRIGARAAVLLGEDEILLSSATVRDLDSGAQDFVLLDELAARLRALCG
jgi:histidyl-tRNA synthetase